jgi:hypothetical protein
LADFLAAAWEQLNGFDAEGMAAEKLDRIEQVEWNPPRLTFVIERHGGTVMGSTRAELHGWSIDIDRGTANCNPSHSYRLAGC